MSEFILIFRRDYKTADAQPSPEKLQESLKQWQEWFTSLAENDMLARPVQRLDAVGKLIKGSTIVEGPYTEVKESIGGLVIIKANDYDEAVEIAESCPVLALGGNVEIRQGL
ncbi:YciI family protein [Pedobacter sp.]|uniref:YciI family protein n=1 Tax=Pedobacter sp. TaxID=1411316 RepID=UPI003C5660A9